MTTEKDKKKRVKIDSEYRALLNEYRNQLTDNVNTSSDEYDKQVIQLSSATIGASFLIIANFPFPQISTEKLWLYSSWIFSTFAILSVIVSFRLSAYENTKELDKLDTDIERGYFEETNNNEANNKSPDYTSWANNASGIGFFFGVLFLLVFSFRIVTFQNGDNNNEQQKDKPIQTEQNKRSTESTETTKTKDNSPEKQIIIQKPPKPPKETQK